MFVSNAELNIPSTNVHFPTTSNQIRQKMFPDQRVHLQLTNLALYPAMSHLLSTPIKVDKLQSYLLTGVTAMACTRFD